MSTPLPPLEHILVTGSAGFIGSNLIEYLLQKHDNYHIISLDKLTYAGNLANLAAVKDHPRHTFVQGDICDKSLLEELFTTYDIRGVFHLAAESHVDNSITGPEIFFMTNVIGTQRLVHTAYRHWMTGPGEVKPGYESARFHLTSTDEVYGTLGETGLFTEETPYAPNPPYAASKAGSDFVIRAYHHTFGLNATISNCSNNYGPHQHPEKLIPTIIRKALSHQPIPLYGDGKNIRDWLYVVDHAKSLDLVYHTGKSGETYIVGCRNEQNNNDMAALICSLLDELEPWEGPNGTRSYAELITYVKDRAGHDRRYAIDPTKIETQLGWTFDMPFEDGLRQTVQWYINGHKAAQSAA